MATQKKTTDALALLDKRYFENNPKNQAALAGERNKDDISRKIIALRESAGMTQKEFAALVGKPQSVISRLEDAEYEGHSMRTLNEIAHALGKRVRLEFEDLPRTVTRPRTAAKAGPGQTRSKPKAIVQ